MKIVQKITRPVSALGIALANCPISGPIGCNFQRFENLTADQLISKIFDYIVEFESLSGSAVKENIERSVILEDEREYSIGVEIIGTLWRFHIKGATDNVDIQFDTASPIIVNMEHAKRLCFLLSVLVHDENEACMLAELGIQLSKQWAYPDVLPDLYSLKEIICRDLVRAQRVKLQERKSVLKELGTKLIENGIISAPIDGDEQAHLFSDANSLKERRDYFVSLESSLLAKQNQLNVVDYHHLSNNMKLAQVELRLDYHSPAYRDWQIGYGLLNGIMVLCTDYVAEALTSLEDGNLQRSTELMQKSARTQDMSADIMAYLGDISRENYTNDIRFKLGGSGGTDHQSHRKLRANIMRYMTVMHRHIESVANKDNSPAKQSPLVNLDGLMKMAMQNKAFDGAKDGEFVFINDDQIAAYVELIDSNSELRDVIEAAMAFKAAHVRVFVCHQHVCKKTSLG